MRICTFNVHAWLDANLEHRGRDAIALLARIDADIVMLNEVPQDAQIRLAAAQLKMDLAYSPAEFAGNAILSRAQLTDVRTVALDTPRGETRALLVACVELDGARTTIACTHLDHRREIARVQQITRVQRELANESRLVLAGDFNALRLADYPSEFVEAIHAHRAAQQWEPAVEHVTQRMDAWGLVDAARVADAGSLDRYASLLAHPIAPHLARTCWVGTRIDYVWLSESVARGRHVTAEVIETSVSDHLPVVVTLA